MLSHLTLLMSADSQRGPRLARAKQDEARLPILGVVIYRVGLIHISGTLEASGARQTAPLVAKCGQDDAGIERSIPNVLFAAYQDRALIIG
jgi:hypothetical protein